MSVPEFIPYKFPFDSCLFLSFNIALTIFKNKKAKTFACCAETINYNKMSRWLFLGSSYSWRLSKNTQGASTKVGNTAPQINRMLFPNSCEMKGNWQSITGRLPSLSTPLTPPLRLSATTPLHSHSSFVGTRAHCHRQMLPQSKNNFLAIPAFHSGNERSLFIPIPSYPLSNLLSC